MEVFFLKTAVKKPKLIETFLLLISFILVLFFQNCTTSANIVENNETTPTVIAAPKSCQFDGQAIFSGQMIQAFQNSSVSFGLACVSENRTCQDGALSGSYAFSSCAVDVPASCLFNAQTINHGLSAVAFQNSNVPLGSVCVSESRDCSNGSMSGSYAFSSCSIAGPASCLFNGQTVAHNSVVIGFQSSSVSSGSVCQQENRVCDNGALTGSFAFASCDVQAPQSCLFNNQTLANGQNVEAFLTSVAPSGGQCTNEIRNCDNGILLGDYEFASCNLAGPQSCLFNGQTVADGQSVEAFENVSVLFGTSCQRQTRTCSNGALSGTYAHSSCVVSPPVSCSFNGQEVVSGSSVVAFEAAMAPSGGSCVAESRMCNNGALSGSHQFGSCTGSAAPAGSCTFNDQIVLTGTSIIAFQTAAVPFGSSCISQSRDCSSGNLTGSYAFSTCTVIPPASCSFNGQTISSGTSVKAYKTSKPNKKGLCPSQNRSCSNGSLSGSFQFSLCQ